MILLKLFFEFFKAGLFAVGGGMATIPFLMDMADNTGWFTRAQLADMVAVSESTPGPIGVNMSTYVGFTTAGIPGALIATLGLVTPSVILILLIARVLQQFRRNRYVENGFYGLRPASAGLIGAAGLNVASMALLKVGTSISESFAINWKAVILAVVVLVLSNWVKVTKKWHPIVFIGISAVVGVVFRFGGV